MCLSGKEDGECAISGKEDSECAISGKEDSECYQREGGR